LCAVGLIVVLPGCSGSPPTPLKPAVVSPAPDLISRTKDIAKTDKDGGGAKDIAGKSEPSGAKDRAKDGGDGGGRDKDSAPAKDKGIGTEPPRRPLMDEPRAGMDRPVPKPDDVPAGVLTAGSFDDNLYPSYFLTF